MGNSMNSPSTQLETRIQQMRERIEPEALLDRKKCGWPQGYSGYAMTHVPFGQAVDELIKKYVQQRRTHFFAVHNIAVDLSGWTFSGGVSFTFRPGTVIPGWPCAITVS